MFDLSGSGKSQGEYITYGLKEQEDIGIQYTIQHLSFSTYTGKNTFRNSYFGEEAWEQSPLSYMRYKITKKEFHHQPEECFQLLNPSVVHWFTTNQ